jgi:hypothetical protein
LGNLHRAAGHVYRLWSAEPLSGQAQLLVDARGIGQGLVDILENLNVPLPARGHDDGGGARDFPPIRHERQQGYAPQRAEEDVGLLDPRVPYQQARLRFVPGKKPERLKHELANFVPPS